jgi:hypothetical protein
MSLNAALMMGNNCFVQTVRQLQVPANYCAEKLWLHHALRQFGRA